MVLSTTVIVRTRPGGVSIINRLALSIPPRTRLGRGTLIAIFVSLYVAAAAYFVLIKGLGSHPSPLLELVFQAAVLGCFGALWLFLEDALTRRESTPFESYWHSLVAAAILAALFFVVVLLIPGGFSENVRQPYAISTVGQSAILAPIFFGFAAFLMLRLRTLVLYRSGRRIRRCWQWMLVLMVLNAIIAGIFEALPENAVEIWVKIAGIVPLVALSAVNVFQMSWVVHLTVGKKFLAIVVAGLLMVFCGLFSFYPDSDGQISVNDTFVTPALFLSYFGEGLQFFVMAVGWFGMTYSLISILALIFHLPTTSVYKRQEGEMDAFYSLTGLVKEVFDLNKLRNTIVKSAVEAHRATMAWLAVPDPDSGFLRPCVVAAHNIEKETVERRIKLNALYDEAASTQAYLYLDQARADSRVLARASDGIASLLAVPLAAHHSVLGVLFVVKNVKGAFEKDDIRALSAFASQAALALDNARMFERQVERERLARELAIARDVQQRLLPQRMPVYEHLDMAAVSVPALEVGGDYYDYVELDDARLAFIVSDVSGKGTSAAFYMAGMHGIFHSLTRIAPDPHDFLVHANRVLGETLERSVFISVIYGIVDSRKQEISLARAGHCPAIVARGSKPVEFLRPAGIGMGLDRSNRFRDILEVVAIKMTPGDTIVFCTDGVVESRSANGEEYGYDRLLASVDSWRHEDAAPLHAALLDDLRTFMGNSTRQYDDDMTLLVIKWCGAT